MKKKKLKHEIHNLETENFNLQSKLERLNTEFQQKLVVSKPMDHQNVSGSSEPSNTNSDCLKLLEKRIASQCSGVSITFI